MLTPPGTKHHDEDWANLVHIKVTVGAIVVVLLLAAAVNVIANPFSLYGTNIIPRPPGMYEKKFILYENFQPPANALIFSNSHIMTFNPDLVEELTGNRCFNFWLPGACTETFYGLIRLVQDQYDNDLDMIIVALGIEIIHPSLPIQPEARYIPELNQYFIHDLSDRGTILDKIGLLFTMGQTRQAAALIVVNLRHTLETEYHPGQARLEYRDNGMTIHATAEEMIAAGTYNLEEKITRRLRSKRYSEEGPVIKGWTGLSANRMAYWLELLEVCRENDIEVYAFMAPVHPLLTELASECGTGHMYAEAQEFFSTTVEEFGGVYRDYLHLDSFGGDPDLFYDELHMRPENSERLLRDLFKDYEPAQDLVAN